MALLRRNAAALALPALLMFLTGCHAAGVPNPSPSPVSGEALVAAACASPEDWSGGAVYQELDPADLFSPEGVAAAGDLPYLCPSPLLSDRAFLYTDPDGDAPIGLVAETLVEQLLDCYSQEREGVPFQIIDYHVGPQSPLSQADLEAMYREDLAPLPEEEARDRMSLFTGEFPLLGAEMWCFTPVFDCAWTGILSPLGPFPGPGEELASISPQGSPEAFHWVLIRWENQYWFQRHLAFLDAIS